MTWVSPFGAAVLFRVSSHLPANAAHTHSFAARRALANLHTSARTEPVGVIVLISRLSTSIERSTRRVIRLRPGRRRKTGKTPSTLAIQTGIASLRQAGPALFSPHTFAEGRIRVSLTISDFGRIRLRGNMRQTGMSRPVLVGWNSWTGTSKPALVGPGPVSRDW